MPYIEKNTKIRLKYNPASTGFTTGVYDPDFDEYEILIGNRKQYINSAEIEVLENEQLTLRELIKDKKFAEKPEFDNLIMYYYLFYPLSNTVFSMGMTLTDFYAYQYKPLLTLLESESDGVLIADEVGLGKTIEAGIIWTELRARINARKLLIISPKIICQKWKSEIESKFGVKAEVMEDSTRLKKVLCDLKSNSDCAIIASYSLAQIALLSPTDDDVQQFQCEFDLIIIDEAHRMRNNNTKSYKVGLAARKITKNLILLSATPINNSKRDLKNLLHIIAPQNPVYQSDFLFENYSLLNQYIVRAKDIVLNQSKVFISAKIELESLSKLHGNTQLQLLIEDSLWSKNKISAKERAYLADRIAKLELFKYILTRTRRKDVKDSRPIRRVNRVTVTMYENELAFYVLVTKLIRNYAKENSISEGFILCAPQRLVSSSMYASAKKWNMNHQEETDFIEETIHENISSYDVEGYKKGHLINYIVNNLQNYSNDDLKNDSKYNRLQKILIEDLKLESEYHKKIVIFSYSMTTLNYLKERLNKDTGLKSEIITSKTKNREQVIKSFKDSSVNILLASEVASEGLDLQFAHILVNYDLPWNPMRLEQRIGRLDRIGQTSKTIEIFNFCYQNTIDEKILNILESKIEYFESVFGNVEEVIGKEINKLVGEYLKQDLTPDEEKLLFSQAEIAIQNNELQQEKLEKEALSLVAHSGYVLSKIHKARDTGIVIDKSDLVRLINLFFTSENSGNSIRHIADNHYNIRLGDVTRENFDQFLRYSGLLHQSYLSQPRDHQCIIENKTYYKSGFEVINQFHPLVKFITYALKEHLDKILYRFSACKLKSSNNELELSLGSYGVYLSKIEYISIFSERKIMAHIINLSTGEVAQSINVDKLLYLIKNTGEQITALEKTNFKEYDLYNSYSLIYKYCRSEFEEERKLRDLEYKEKIQREINSLEEKYKNEINKKTQLISDLIKNGDNNPIINIWKKELAIKSEEFKRLKENMENKLNNFSAKIEEMGFILLRLVD